MKTLLALSIFIIIFGSCSKKTYQYQYDNYDDVNEYNITRHINMRHETKEMSYWSGDTLIIFSTDVYFKFIRLNIGHTVGDFERYVDTADIVKNKIVL